MFVILSGAKNLFPQGQILRSAQNDSRYSYCIWGRAVVELH